MKRIIILVALTFTQILTFAQGNKNLRKVILKSDLIIETDAYNIENSSSNDFTSKMYVQIKKIDATNSIVYKNKLPSVPKKLSLRKYNDDEDFYSDFLVNQECGCLGKAYEPGKVYSDLFFIRKEKNEYQILMHFHSLTSEQVEAYKKQIESINIFENVKNEEERFTKTLDWFIDNGLMSDYDFLDYYKQKGITKDSIQYSEKQYQNAFQKFKTGNENLLPIVRERYFEEVKQYYIEKMEAVVQIQKPEFGNYYDFGKAFVNIIGENGLDYDSADYILYNALTSDKFDFYDKYRIMNHLIEVAKEWQK
jgi:hypothetical protein